MNAKVVYRRDKRKNYKKILRQLIKIALLERTVSFEGDVRKAMKKNEMPFAKTITYLISII